MEQRDIDILRDLARRQAEIAADPVNEERRRAWYDLHDLRPNRPMVLAEWGGIRDPHKPFMPELVCEDGDARNLEAGLRCAVWQFEELRDDHVIEPYLNVGWNVSSSGWGVQKVDHASQDFEGMGAKRWDPPIVDLDADFEKLRPQTFSVDRDATRRRVDFLREIFDDILEVRIRGSFWWSFGMTIHAINLIGLEMLMLAMYDNPDGLHRIMRFLCDDHLSFARWLEREGLLTCNDENDYVGSGTQGYVSDLPQPDHAEGAPARTKDLWVLLESQETVGVGPDLFAEFIFPYQKEIADAFGLVYYGCCEPVHTRRHVLEGFDNMRAVSVSPWCDEAFMADAVGRRYVYSRKPNPTLISTARFDEDTVRADFRATLDAARNCNLEIIMKDVHTLHDEPGRLARWVEIAREEIAAS